MKRFACQNAVQHFKIIVWVLRNRSQRARFADAHVAQKSLYTGQCSG